MADAEEVASDVKGWLAETWDPDRTVREWWELLADSGWAAPTWPEEWFGRGLTRDMVAVVNRAFADAEALGPPTGLGMMLAGPTILAHGSDEQKQRYLRPIVTGAEAWCQLFSEPGAGSDLAGLESRAVADGEEWVVTGQKVWTSGAQVADLGMLLARTDPNVPKHSGISYFAIDMDQPTIDIRPLREMTGRALFNEVFMTEARVTDDALIGGRNNGWAVAMTTLANERSSLGAGGAGGAIGATPGTKAGHLDFRAGDFVGQGRAAGGGLMAGRSITGLIALAQGAGRSTDPTIRQDLVRLYSLNEIARYTTLRTKAAQQQGKRPGPEANTAKLSMSRITRLSREVGLRILGAHGTLAGRDAPMRGAITELALFSPAVSIYGGSDEIQRNIIGERVLGLPGEPRAGKDVPFRDLKVGTQRS